MSKVKKFALCLLDSAVIVAKWLAALIGINFLILFPTWLLAKGHPGWFIFAVIVIAIFGVAIFRFNDDLHGFQTIGDDPEKDTFKWRSDK